MLVSRISKRASAAARTNDGSAEPGPQLVKEWSHIIAPKNFEARSIEEACKKSGDYAEWSSAKGLSHLSSTQRDEQVAPVSEQPPRFDASATGRSIDSLAGIEIDHQAWKVHARIDGELQRAPEPRIDFHQHRTPRGRTAVFHHRHRGIGRLRGIFFAAGQRAFLPLGLAGATPAPFGGGLGIDLEQVR